jgi:hypothetical protein
LEIDLADAHGQVLDQAVFSGLERKRWLFNAAVQRARDQIEQLASWRSIEREGGSYLIRECPLSRRVISVRKCTNCPYLALGSLSVEPDQSGLLCLGEHRVRSYKELRCRS